MAQLMKILVTGATGNVGREVIAALPHAAARVVAAVRDVDRARAMLGDDLAYVRFDFADPASYAAALEGVDALFLVRPPAIADVKGVVAPFIAAAVAAGVGQIVFLSLLGAERIPVVPHAAIERAIVASGVSHTFLRASFFMQNLSTTHRDEIREADILFVPAGDGRTSFIDVRDIAAVAARSLLDRAAGGRAHALTGAAALTYGEVAELLSAALGRPIRYTRPSLAAFLLRHIGLGEPLAYALVLAAIYTSARLGQAGEVTDDLPRLLGRQPIDMRQFIADNRQCWA